MPYTRRWKLANTIPGNFRNRVSDSPLYYFHVYAYIIRPPGLSVLQNNIVIIKLLVALQLRFGHCNGAFFKLCSYFGKLEMFDK
jgi:hypothetical protein